MINLSRVFLSFMPPLPKTDDLYTLTSLRFEVLKPSRFFPVETHISETSWDQLKSYLEYSEKRAVMFVAVKAVLAGKYILALPL